jgi:hypothetical protein
MKNIGILSVLIFSLMVLTTAGCATYTTHYDYDPGVRFEELSNYDWLNPPDTGQPVNELTIKRIKAALEKQLTVLGYSMATSNPDFLIAIHGGKQTKINVVDWGYTYRGNEQYHYGYTHRAQRVDVYEYEQGTLILDFVDAASQELIWRGTVTGVIDPNPTPEKRDKVINEAVAKVLENFPPPVE